MRRRPTSLTRTDTLLHSTPRFLSGRAEVPEGRKRTSDMRRLDVINLDAEEQRPAPAMPRACETGGCGGPGDMAPTPELPSFGEVRVNGVEILPEAIGRAHV